jgi:outer membrane biosynthesis protein TonB
MLQVDDPSLQSLHAVLNIENGMVTLFDVGAGGISVNGSTINSSQEIQTGDSIQIGNIRFGVDIGHVGFGDDESTQPDIEAPPQASPPPTASAPVSPVTGLSPSLFAEEPPEEFQDSVQDALKFVQDSNATPSANTDASKPKVLEITQIYGQQIQDVLHFKLGGENVTMGIETGNRLRFAGKPVAWVPGAFAKMAWMMYPFTEAAEEWKSDFYSPVEGSKHSFSLFSWQNEKPVCNLHKSWSGFVDGEQPKEIKPSDSDQSLVLEEGQKITIDTGTSLFYAQIVPATKTIASGGVGELDYPFLALLMIMATFFGASTYMIMTGDPPPDTSMEEIEDRFAELLLDEPPEPPKEEKKPDSNPDAGEGAKAKKEEGKVGKKDAKMKEAKGNKVDISERQKNLEAVNAATSWMDEGGLDVSADNLDPNLAGAIGGLIGAKGVQGGAGGLGSRGSGLGGGGTASGLGGMGSKGSGRGSSGYGTGKGSFGKKREGGIGRIGGQPIILGALDKSLIDAVIKRNMRRIRYCYQRQLPKNPSLGGKIVVKFVISKTGSVSKASIKSSSMGSAAVEDCIANKVFRTLKFPEPKGGGIVIVSYPFIFSPE